MNEIIIAILDDSMNDRALLQGYLEKVAKELGKTFQIYTFSNGIDFTKKIHPVFDVVFLNTTIPDMNITETVKRLQERNLHVHLVFLSQDPATVSMGYEYGARNHLVKPFSYVTILTELKKYIQSEIHLSDPFLWVSNRDGHFKLFYSRLRYAETENRHLIFHYEDQVIRHAGRISNFVEKLPDELFFRCNNSYIVNLSYISSIVPDGNRYRIQLITGEEIPLSRSRYRSLLSRLQEAI